MSRKLFLALILLAAMAGNILAVPVDKTFTNGDTNNNFNKVNNWSPVGVPATDARVLIMGDTAGAVGPLIDNDVNIGQVAALAGNAMLVGYGGAETALLTVSGGTVITGAVFVGQTSAGTINFNNATWNSTTNYQSWYIGGRDMAGVMNIGSGTIYMEDLFCPWRTGGTTGQLNMTGGTIYVNDDVKLDGLGTVNLDGGKIEQTGNPFGYNETGNAEFLLGYGTVFNITGTGKLILNGDASDSIDGCVTVLGVLQGYGDPEKIYWDYNVTTPGKTTIWAQTTPRYDYFSEVTLFEDNFGASAFDTSKWTVSANWVSSTNIPAGTTGFSATLPASKASSNLTMVNGIDTTGPLEVFVDFWCRDDDMESADLTLQFNSSTAPTTYTVYRNLGGVTEDQWTHYTVILRDQKYMFNGLSMRFNAVTASGENAWIDEVVIKARYSKEPKPASNPTPANGAPGILATQQLRWLAGYLSVSHDVYFGTDLNLVTNATKTSALCVSKNQTGTTYSPTLAYNKTYYWRIDENYDGAHPDFGVSGTLKGTVWSFTTMVSAPVDPNLMGWWKFDDAAALTAADSSGFGHDGTFDGNSAIISDPTRGNVLSLDGAGDYVNLGNGGWTNPGNHTTIAAWFKTASVGFDAANATVIAKGNSTFRLAREASSDIMSVWMNYPPSATTQHIDGIINVNDNQWHYIVATYDGTTMKLYIDGTQDGSSVTMSALNTTTANLCIGRNTEVTSRDWNGFIDDVRFYNRALSATEITNIFVATFTGAWNPVPANATSPFREHYPTLTWTAGKNAVSHDVYFGTNQTYVQDANTAANFGTYKGRKSTAQYAPTGPLAYGQSYYWRVDEVNASSDITQGSVWWFRVRNFNNFEDFEDFNEITNPIDTTPGRFWGDNDYNHDVGGHAYIGRVATLDPVIDTQSLKFAYDNFDWAHWLYYCSELVRVLDVAENWSWTGGGVKSIYLQIYGNTTNGADRLYIALEDDSGHSYTIYHPDPEVLITAAWQTWNIPLANFTGVNLTKVKKIFLGVGTRYETTQPLNWFAGTVYIDDIRVYPPRCMANITKPVGDISNNCVVDLADVRLMANSWLKMDTVIQPTPVSDSNLEGKWNFDDGTANDSSGKGRNGVAEGVVSYVDDAARGSKVLNLINGPGNWFNRINCGGSTTDPLHPGWANGFKRITVSCWASIDQFNADYQYLIAKEGAWRIMRMNLENHMRFYTNVAPASLVGTDASNIQGGTWHHVACVYDGTTKYMYIDGALDATQTVTTAGGILGTSAFNVIIGGTGRTDSQERSWNGKIDDVRIYSRALSQTEILTLAGITGNFIIPVDQIANLSPKNVPGQEIINYKDFSVIADNWLKVVLWP